MNMGITVQRAFHVRNGKRSQKELREGRADHVPRGRVPRVARLMALAIRFDRLIRDVRYPDAGRIVATRAPSWLDQFSRRSQMPTGRGRLSSVRSSAGQMSGAFYGGVAPGADLIGLVAGNDVGLTTFTIVTAYDWILVNQFRPFVTIVTGLAGSMSRSFKNTL